MTLKKAPYAFGLLLVMLADVAVAGLNEAPRESDQPTTPAEKKASAGLQTAQPLTTATPEEALLTVRGQKASSTRILARVSMSPNLYLTICNLFQRYCSSIKRVLEVG